MRINTTRSHRANCLLSLFTISVCCCCCCCSNWYTNDVMMNFDTLQFIYICMYICCVTDDDVAHAPDDAQSYASIWYWVAFRARFHLQTLNAVWIHNRHVVNMHMILMMKLDVLLFSFYSSFFFLPFFIRFWGDGVRSPKYIQSIKCRCVCVLRLKSTLKR